MVTGKIRATDWLATFFYPLAVILMEAFWVSPLLNWIGAWPLFHEQRPVLGLLSVIIILTVSLGATRIFTRLSLPMRSVQAIVIGMAAVVMLIVLGVEYRDGYTFFSGAWFAHLGSLLGSFFSNPSTVVIAMPAVIYLWWRGIRLGQSTSYFKDIYRSFAIGLGILITLIIFWKLTDVATTTASPTGGLGLNVIAFFFFGLLSIAICHLYVMRSSMPKEDASLTSVWRWMPVMLGIIGGMVLIGFLIATFLSPEMMKTLSHGLGAVGSALGTFFKWILTPFIYLFQYIFQFVIWLIGLLRRTNNNELSGNGSSGAPDWGDVTSIGTPAWLTEAAKWTGIVIVVGLVVLVLARTVSRYRARKAQESMDEVNESLFSWKNLRDDLSLLLKNLGDRFKRKQKPEVEAFDPNAAGRLNVREIFKHLQWEGHKSGVTRRRYETASEYARRLERAVPDSVESIGIVRESIGGIKDMYEVVRYGEAALPEPQVDKANGFWQTLRGMLRRLRGE